MKSFLTVTLLLLQSLLWGQDTVYYDNSMEHLPKGTATYQYWETIDRDPNDTNKVKVNTYYKSGQMRAERLYFPYSKKVNHGRRRAWYENGQIKMDLEYNNGQLNGTLLSYWPNGKPKRIDNYENDSLINGKCTDSTGRTVVHFPFLQKPHFQGSPQDFSNYISSNIQYPKAAREKGVEGRVVIQFTVAKNGAITKVKILEKISPELDTEALRVVNTMPAWEPGLEDGEPVSFYYTLPVRFRLER